MSSNKSCDVRGGAAAELSADLYNRWGRALGRQLPAMAKFVVGGDGRDCTPPLLAALVEGLCQEGLDVVDLGLLPTPMIYYAKYRLRADGCAIVVAADDPAAGGGLKWMLGERPPTPDEAEALQRAATSSPLPLEEGRGEGEAPAKPRGSAGASPSRGTSPSRQFTTPRTLDVSFDYVACLQETFVESLTARQHVVVDTMHGLWTGKARRYLHAIFPQCLFSTIHDDDDSRMEHESRVGQAQRSPTESMNDAESNDGGTALRLSHPTQIGNPQLDCLHADRLDELGAEVYRQRAHLGVAFDRGGERLALVDGDGVALSPEETACTLLECLGKELRGQRFLCDVRFSDHVAAAARRLGAEPLLERSGPAFVRARMAEIGAALGAEPSGHYFHRVLEGGADGLYTACRLIAHLARLGCTLAELRRKCPPVYMTPELHVPVAAEAQAGMIERVRAAWAGFPQLAIDGVRIDIPGGWALVRSSPTEPAMLFRFEGLDWHALEDIVRRFCNALPECGGHLWGCYRAALGGEGQ